MSIGRIVVKIGNVPSVCPFLINSQVHRHIKNKNPDQERNYLSSLSLSTSIILIVILVGIILNYVSTITAIALTERSTGKYVLEAAAPSFPP